MFNYRLMLNNCVLYFSVIIWYAWFRIPHTTEFHYINLIESRYRYINLIESFFTLHNHKTIHRISQVNLIVETQFPIFVCVKISKADSYSTCFFDNLCLAFTFQFLQPAEDHEKRMPSQFHVFSFVPCI